MTEADFQVLVTDYASLRGWLWVHFRPGRTHDGEIRTMVEGPLGKGWPDLVMIRPPDRILFVELKTDNGRLSPDQEGVISALRSMGILGLDVEVWRPRDWESGLIQRLIG